MLNTRAFCWCIVCFSTSNGSFRILIKAWEFFSKWYNFHNILKIISFQKNISSNFFQYSDRTLACIETNDTSAESLGSQLFGDWGTRAWQGQEGATPTCRKRHWKKSRFNGAKSGRKKKFSRFNFKCSYVMS